MIYGSYSQRWPQAVHAVLRGLVHRARRYVQGHEFEGKYVYIYIYVDGQFSNLGF